MNIYQSVFESAPDPILFVDRGGLILRINAEGSTAFGYGEGELIGKPIEALLPQRLGLSHARHREGYMASPHTRPMGTGRELLGRRKDGSEFPVDVMLSTAGTPEGMVVIAIIRNISERVELEKRQVELIGSLQASLKEIKVLRGLLPICSHCKRIRDGEGNWEVLEKYFQGHLDVNFSHGICPTCIARYYPGFPQA